MLFSYNWLKEYFDQDLPKAKDLADLLLIHSFEIEGLEERVDDHIIDIDILPNRAHDALCHYGMAREISVITGLDVKNLGLDKDIVEATEKNNLKVKIEDERCLRYMAQEIRGVKVGPSPDELVKKLQAIDQRSINNIVDITNLIMFELNQPMHAFDYDKLDGDILVRAARDGEHLTTLDNQEVDLISEYLLIADSKDPLALAGVKGGKKAEVDFNTKNIVLESANFDPVSTRKTSQKTTIKTESSKRYENGITPELTQKALRRAVELIKKYASDDETIICEAVDVYPNPVEQKEVRLGIEKLNSVLGVDLSKEVDSILDKLNFEYEKNGDGFKIKIPSERLDLNIEEDLIEEIGRIYGYDNVPDQEIKNLQFDPKINTEYMVNSIIRKTMIELGFSEVMTYSFVEKGVIEPEKPLSEDRKYLRPSLEEGLNKALELNQKNVEWLGLDRIKIFEIGKVFDGKPGDPAEKMSFGIGVINKQGVKKPKEGIFIKEAVDKVSQVLDIKIDVKINEGEDTFVEIDLSSLYKKIDLEKISDGKYLDFPQSQNESYTAVSQFPFVLRDIAVWLPSNIDPNELISIIKENSEGLLVRDPKLFDVYEKDDKTSYAYRLVFQSYQKTLTDLEVNEIMDKISKEIESKGWGIR